VAIAFCIAVFVDAGGHAGGILGCNAGKRGGEILYENPVKAK